MSSPHSGAVSHPTGRLQGEGLWQSGSGGFTSGRGESRDPHGRCGGLVAGEQGADGQDGQLWKGGDLGTGAGGELGGEPRRLGRRRAERSIPGPVPPRARTLPRRRGARGAPPPDVRRRVYKGTGSQEIPNAGAEPQRSRQRLPPPPPAPDPPARCCRAASSAPWPCSPSPWPSAPSRPPPRTRGSGSSCRSRWPPPPGSR